MKTTVRFYFLFMLIFLSEITFAQKPGNGLYISYKGGLLPKYAILTVMEDSASMEIFTRWQGAWLPAIGAWDTGYKPQILNFIGNRLENKNIEVEGEKNEVKGIARNTFLGKVKFKFTAVEKLPASFQKVRNESLKFVLNKPRL